MAKKSWQGDVRESAHKIWLAGLGALAVAEEEGSKLFRTLVDEGERFERSGKDRLKEAKRGAEQAAERARRLADEAAERAKQAAEGTWEQVGGTLDETLTRTLHRLGVPTRDEIAALSKRIEELTRAVDRVQSPKAAKPPAPAAGKTGGAKPSASRPAAGAKRRAAPKVATTKDVVTTTADVVTKP